MRKDLSNHKSPCLLRLMEKTMPYNIDIRYIPGGDNAVADTFSRLCSSTTEAEEVERLFAPSMNNFAKKVTSWGQNIGEEIIRLARFGDIDTKYKQFIEDIKSAKRPRNAKEGDMIRDYRDSVNLLFF